VNERGRGEATLLHPMSYDAQSLMSPLKNCTSLGRNQIYRLYGTEDLVEIHGVHLVIFTFYFLPNSLRSRSIQTPGDQ
jgi:hypothetical protein